MDTTNVYKAGLGLMKVAEKVLDEIDNAHIVEAVVGDGGDYHHNEDPWSGAEQDMRDLRAAIENMREAIARAAERGAEVADAFIAMSREPVQWVKGPGIRER